MLTPMMAHLIFTRPFEPDDAHASGRGFGQAEVRANGELAAAVALLGERYLASEEALIHGDLHVASVLVAPGRPVVLDYEFARTGPVGFDLGLLWANIMLVLPVARMAPGAPASACASLAVRTWTAFATEFTTLAKRSQQDAPGSGRSSLTPSDTRAARSCDGW